MLYSVTFVAVLASLSLVSMVSSSRVGWYAFNGGGSRSGINEAETAISSSTVDSLSQLWKVKINNSGADVIDSTPLFMYDVHTADGKTQDLIFVHSMLGTTHARTNTVQHAYTHA